ncbi:MAG: beta-lactamase family protein [Bdellovibrionaceae bacterium]|nr:beta-lactamase family protein [Pseudobdellovibrionaceae bacterium]
MRYVFGVLLLLLGAQGVWAIDSAAIKKLRLQSQQKNSSVLLLSVNNRLLIDDISGGSDRLYSLQAVTQGLFALAAIAELQDQKIDLSTSAQRWYPEWLDNRMTISFLHLFSHSSGFAEQDSLLFTQKNMMEWGRKQILTYSPGTQFVFSNTNFIVAGDLVQRATGKNAEQIIRHRLFLPLSITKSKFEKDHSGNFISSGGLHLRPYDLLKIGHLIANNGLFAKRNLIATSIIEKIGEPSRANSQYGLGWWLADSPKGKVIYTQGYQGQFLVIIPKQKIVAVRLKALVPEEQIKPEEEWESFPREIIKL